MKIAMKWAYDLIFSGVIVGVITSLSAFPIRATAQNPGNNAVYNSSGTCTSSSCGFSAAFVDASVFGNSRTDICTVLNNILS
jgi:hypothetical protein